MKHLTRIIVMLLAVMIMATAFIGCQNQAKETAAVEQSAEATEQLVEAAEQSVEEEAHEPVTIQFLQWWASEGAVAESLDGLIADFEAEYPYITVELVSLPFGDTKTQIVANHAAGTIADVVGVNPPWTREFVDLGILEPLDSYMANDPNFNKDDYFPASMAPINESTYLAPYNTLSFFLFYNVDMFEAAGLQEPKTWDDVATAAAALTDANNNKYGFTMSMSEVGAANGSIVSLYPLLYAANGRTLIDEKYSCQTEEMTAAMNLIKTLSDQGSIIPGENVKDDPMMIEEFSLGNIGMMIQNDAHVATLAAKNPDMNYRIIPIPTIDGTGKPVLRHHGWDLAMTAKGKNKDAAWKFISFLLRKENMEKASIEMKKTPSMYGIEASADASEPEKIAKQYLAEYDMVEELMAMPSASACWEALTEAGITVLKGLKTVEQALADCQAEWDSILGQ